MMADPRIEDLLDEIDQLTGSKAALQTEIERLVALSDKMWIERVAERKELKTKIERLQKIVDGTERRESEYLALIEKKHLLLQERNDEVARLRGDNTKLQADNERLKAERHTTKRMLEDILYKHDQHYGLGRGGLRTVKPEER